MSTYYKYYLIIYLYIREIVINLTSLIEYINLIKLRFPFVFHRNIKKNNLV